MNTLYKLASMVGMSTMSDHQVNPIVEREFVQHIAEFGKSYGTKEEYQFRLSLFAEKHAAIAEENSKNGSYILGHNQFSDWTNAEYKKLLGFKQPRNHLVKASNPTILDTVEAP